MIAQTEAAQLVRVILCWFSGLWLASGPHVDGTGTAHTIVVPFFGLTNSILRILKGNPKKELQWRQKESPESQNPKPYAYGCRPYSKL